LREEHCEPGAPEAVYYLAVEATLLHLAAAVEHELEEAA
jgi:hypothetical protein